MVNIHYINTILLNTVPYQKVKNTAFDEFFPYMAYIRVICVKTKLTKKSILLFQRFQMSSYLLLFWVLKQIVKDL